MIAAGDNVVSDHDAAREVFSDVELVALDEQLRRSS
jgi:hypothetical protein